MSDRFDITYSLNTYSLSTYLDSGMTLSHVRGQIMKSVPESLRVAPRLPNLRQEENDQAIDLETAQQHGSR